MMLQVTTSHFKGLGWRIPEPGPVDRIELNRLRPVGPRIYERSVLRYPATAKQLPHKRQGMLCKQRVDERLLPFQGFC